MLEVTEIWVYPVKSCAGVALDRCELDEHGPVLDRRWMIVDDENRFLTQRKNPRLALVRPTCRLDGLRLEAPGLDPLRVPELAAGDAPERRVTCWRDTLPALDAGDEAAEWISSWLARSARLVLLHPDARRAADPAYAPARATTSFTDGFPLLVVGQGSLDALNERLDSPLPMNRFRPNLVVGGAEPHAEDSWRRLRIGRVELELVKACTRCVTTTVDQETAESGREPLATLARYRLARTQEGSVVEFGMNAVHAGPGSLERGAEVEVLQAS